MILHSVTFTFAPGTTPEQVAAVDAALAALPGRIDVLRRYEHGADLGLRDGNADYAVAAWVDDEEALNGYLDHPAHVEAVQTAVLPVLATRAAVQLHVGGV